MLLIIVALCILIILLINTNFSNFQSEIPKIIWTYWDGELSEFASECISTWYKTNPDWQVVILNKENLRDHLPDVDIFSFKYADTPARTSDFIRLHVLAKHGGVWCDATSIIPKSLNWIDPKYDYTGYRKTNEGFKEIESWFFACKPGCDFVTKWRDEFTRMNSYDTLDDYIRDVESEGVQISQIDDLPYLVIYVACQRVIPTVDTDKLFLIDVRDHQKHFHGHLAKLCEPISDDVPVLKFTRYERMEIEKNSDIKECYLTAMKRCCDV